MNNNLTARMQISILPLLLKRDCGFFCFYCNCDLSKTKHVYEHLDDDRSHNELENIVLACISCNNKKPSSTKMKKLALKKKKMNEKRNSMRKCVIERTKKSTTRINPRLEVPAPSFKPEMDISETNFQIAEQFLLERLTVEDEIEFKIALDSITMMCRNQTGTGSQPAVRRYLDALVSPEGKFMVAQNSEKQKVIILREGK